MEDSLELDDFDIQAEKTIHYRYSIRNQFDTVRGIYNILEDIIDDSETSVDELICITEELRNEVNNLVDISKLWKQNLLKNL